MKREGSFKCGSRNENDVMCSTVGKDSNYRIGAK